MAEYFSREINKAFERHQFLRFSTKGRSVVSHLGFADDIIIFSNGQKRSIEKIARIIKGYEHISGQKVNKGKSCFIIGNKVPPSRTRCIKRVLGYKHNQLPIKYLGCPLYYGRLKEELFAELINKVRKRIISWENKFLSAGGKLILLKTILNSMPIYLFQVMQPPGGVMKKLERLFNSFFWGSTEAKRKLHWKSWDKMCYPTEEGGIGIRRIKDMVMAFSMKMWWRFRTQENLWATFMMRKYGRKLPPQLMEAKAYDSHAWKRMCWMGKEAEQNIIWAVGEGKLNLWSDKWIQGASLSELLPDRPANREKVEEIIEGLSWNAEKIRNMFPSNICERILKVNIGEDDRAFWIGAEGGTFSTKSAWQSVRQRKQVCSLFRNIWHSSIPTKISVFGWRAVQDLIPTEMRMKGFKVAMPSKCMCCEQEETSTHVFMDSDLAKEVWHYFYNSFAIPIYNYQSIPAMLKGWAASHDWVYHGHVRTSIPLIVMWEIWKARNNAKHNQVTMTAIAIIRAVENKVRSLLDAKVLKFKHCKGENTFIHKHHIRPEQRKKGKVTSFYWRMPDLGWLKLNTDGCSKGNPGRAAAGALLRDHRGNVIFTFCANLGVQSAYTAELMALKEGIKICKSMQAERIWIELDSKVICRQITEKARGNWKSFHLLAEIHSMLAGFSWNCSHTWRESNAAADCLANMGLRMVVPSLSFGRPPPGRLSAITRMDAEGTPYLRAIIED